jgi:hypothetical protein
MMLLVQLQEIRDSSVGVATGRPAGVRFFSTPQRQDRLWGPPSLYPVGTGVKRQGREADTSPPTSAEAKNRRAIIPPPIRVHDVVFNCLIN